MSCPAHHRWRRPMIYSERKGILTIPFLQHHQRHSVPADCSKNRHLATAWPQLQPHYDRGQFLHGNHKSSLTHFQSRPPPLSHGNRCRIRLWRDCLSDQLPRTICSSQPIYPLLRINTYSSVSQYYDIISYYNTLRVVTIFCCHLRGMESCRLLSLGTRKSYLNICSFSLNLWL